MVVEAAVLPVVRVPAQLGVPGAGLAGDGVARGMHVAVRAEVPWGGVKKSVRVLVSG